MLFKDGVDAENKIPQKPGLSSEYTHINNLQITVGGSNIFANDLRYTYQTFTQEFLNTFGINANESTGLGSGLTGYEEWLKNPYYYVDCTRVPDELSKAYRPVQISGTNVSSKKVTYQIFCFYERGFKLNTLSGEIENKV